LRPQNPDAADAGFRPTRLPNTARSWPPTSSTARALFRPAFRLSGRSSAYGSCLHPTRSLPVDWTPSNKNTTGSSRSSSTQSASSCRHPSRECRESAFTPRDRKIAVRPPSAPIPADRRWTHRRRRDDAEGAGTGAGPLQARASPLDHDPDGRVAVSMSCRRRARKRHEVEMSKSRNRRSGRLAGRRRRSGAGERPRRDRPTTRKTGMSFAPMNVSVTSPLRASQSPPIG